MLKKSNKKNDKNEKQYSVYKSKPSPKMFNLNLATDKLAAYQ